MEKKGKGKNIQSVQRAIDIINCFDANNVELTLHEISECLNLNKSTVHGIINTLHNNQFIQQNSNGSYMLGVALFNKSVYSMHASKTRLRSLSKGHMARISNKYQCTSHVFSLEGNRLKFLDMTTPVNSHYVISVVLNDIMKLYCTASGKILLSRMSVHERNEYFKTSELVPFTNKTLTTKAAVMENINEIIEKGYSFENEEIEEGCLSIAVPILTNDDALFGTLSVTGAKVKISGKVDEIVGDLKDISYKICQELFE